jgi:hypothetical protein
MRSAKTAAVPVALALGLVAAAPAAEAQVPPKSQASGGDVVELTYPSIVRTRVTRTERALERATRKFENDKPDAAARPLKVVRRQMAAAWRGAKYKIRTAPPAPPADDARARASGDGPTGPTYASPADTAFRVLTLQHDVAADLTQLVDGAPDAGFAALSTTLSFTLDLRDRAIQDIVKLAPPAPSDDEEGSDDEGAEDARVHARASGDGPVVTTFDTVMPNVPPQLDDELETIDEIKSDSTELTPDSTDELTPDSTELTAAGRSLLEAAEAQIGQTKTVVNKNWPPAPAED